MKKIYTLTLLLSACLFSSAQVATDIDGIYSSTSGRLLRLQYSSGLSYWESHGTYTSPCGDSFYFDPAYPIIKDMSYVSANKWIAKERYYCTNPCTYHYLDIEMSFENSGQTLKRTLTTTSFPCNASNTPTVSYWYRSVQAGLTNNTMDDAILSVYYTPASSSIQVSSNIDIQAQFYLYDLNGKLLFKNTLESESTSIKVQDLVEGIYFYSVIDSNTNYRTGKIVVTD